MNENPVLYGIKDAKVSTPSLYDSILFGKPIWLAQPEEIQQRCSICGKPLVLLLQIYCPFPESDLNRKLFILFCTEHCKDVNGWKIIRQVEQKNITSTTKTIGTTNWEQDGDDDWGDDDDWTLEKDIEEMKIEEKCFESKVQIHEPGYYVNVVEDNDDADLTYELELLNKYESEEGKMETNDTKTSGISFCEEDDEEESLGDKMMAGFLDCCRKIPNQLLRYQIKGRPLMLESQYSSGRLVPQCDQCGAQRIFELQLMPYLTSFCPVLSFGTIQIYTCSVNCGTGSLESCIFQAEPDASNFK